MTDQNSPSVNGTARQVRDALRSAFSLGWQIVELQCRLQVRVPDSSPDRALRLPGMWHSCFNRIATITSDAFPDGVTANTLYAPPSAHDMPYLYPSLVPSQAAMAVNSTAAAVVTAGAPAPFDYADVGICPILREDTDKKKKIILKDFQIYDVTRRAINCLTLLSTREEDSLIPDVLRNYRADLLTQLRPVLPQSATAEELRAREFLTTQACKFLEAWHGYLRQNYYTGGKVPDNNLELIAYEAGHAMSALSWELLLNTLELETAEGIDKSKALEEAWNKKFTDQAIIRLQHQISALSAAMDDAFYQEHPQHKASKDAASLSVPNPDVPSQSIQAVKSSLDYWIAAVKWLSQHKGSFHDTDEIAWRRSLRLALIEQTNVWQTLLSGQESLRGYNVETAAHKIMEDITQEIGESLRQGFRTAVRQAEMLLQETKREATAAIGSVFESGRSVCWIVLGLGVLIAVVGVIAWDPASLAQMGKSLGLTGILSGLGSMLFGGYKWAGLNTSRSEATQKIEKPASSETSVENSGFLTRMEGAVQNAESAVLKAFQRGYEQMRIELDSLNRSIAVTYPLIEFFGRELKLDSNVDFLTDIFWSGTKREEEIRRVIRAAFGGLALMVDTKSGPAGISPQTNRAAH